MGKQEYPHLGKSKVNRESLERWVQMYNQETGYIFYQVIECRTKTEERPLVSNNRYKPIRELYMYHRATVVTETRVTQNSNL